MNIVSAKISSNECERPLPAENWYVAHLLAYHWHPLVSGTSLDSYKKSTFIKLQSMQQDIKLCFSCFSDFTVVIFMLTPLWIFNMLHSVKQVDTRHTCIWLLVYVWKWTCVVMLPCLYDYILILIYFFCYTPSFANFNQCVLIKIK